MSTAATNYSAAVEGVRLSDYQPKCGLKLERSPCKETRACDICGYCSRHCLNHQQIRSLIVRYMPHRKAGVAT